MTGSLNQEFIRKLFHMLTLVYLWAFRHFGLSKAAWILAVWLLIEGALEFARLRLPALNQRLISAFGSIHRDNEIFRISGIFWTGLGCWLTILAFGRTPEVVSAAILYLALGDAAAALAGKAFGQRPLPFMPFKTWEGSLACFVVCAIIGWLHGFAGLRLWLGAFTATLLESVPVPFNDNFWLPLGSGLVLWLKSP